MDTPPLSDPKFEVDLSKIRVHMQSEPLKYKEPVLVAATNLQPTAVVCQRIDILEWVYSVNDANYVNCQACLEWLHA